MTGPSPQPPSRELIDRQDRAAIRLEQRLAAQLAAPLRAAHTQLTQRLTAEYARLAGSIDQPLPDNAHPLMQLAAIAALVEWAQTTLDSIPALVQALLEAARDAIGLGIAQAVRQLRHRPDMLPAVEPAIADAIARMRELLEHDVAAAIQLGSTLGYRRYSDVLAAAGKANRPTSRTEATARWVANRGVAAGATQVTDTVGAAKLWIAERDACLTCLAYSGQVAPAGADFPAGLTFGDYSTVKVPLDGPPAHPNCRCRVIPWLGSYEGVGPVEMPEALRREARRSVVKGSSEYASRPARLRAAQRLITAGAGLPKSVIEQGVRDVRSQRFHVPGRRPPRPVEPAWVRLRGFRGVRP